MRMDDYQKWLDEQFFDDEETVSPASESSAFPAETLVFEPLEPVPPTSTSASPVQEESSPATRLAESRQVPQAAGDETEIPAFESYLPFLRPREIEPQPPLPAEEEAADADAVLVETVPPAVEEPVSEAVQDAPIEREPPLTRSTVAAEPQDSPRESESRRRPIRQASAPDTRESLDSEKIWSLVPKHLQVLMAIESEGVAQNSYKRQFKESRVEMISRLLDPTLSLEDTARLLDVCPTTVRRYTNRGLLTHQRTQGDQRRFRLSDVLSFLEAQSRKDT